MVLGNQRKLSGLRSRSKSIKINTDKQLCLGISDPLVVQRQVIVLRSKPLYHLIAIDYSRFLCQENSIRRIFPVTEVFHKSMLLWILVNVGDHVPKLALRCDWDALKGVLE